MANKSLIAIIVPAYNEAEVIKPFCKRLKEVLKDVDFYWYVMFVDDGSSDKTVSIIEAEAKTNKQVQLLRLSRNFGKEIALSAGLHAVDDADAAIMIDADLQHPPRYIKDFVAKWRTGADVVIGVRSREAKESYVKQFGSTLFYSLINRISEVKIKPRATDFRLIDRQVIAAFKTMPEHSRITRGLIDWLGYDRQYIDFDTDAREHGVASYSTKKLFKLAMDSFVSLSFFPLKLAMYVGVIVTIVFGALGLFMYTDKYILTSRFDFTGPASVGVLVVFLVGILLINIGVLGIYLANIHEQVRQRPLYAVKKPRK